MSDLSTILSAMGGYQEADEEALVRAMGRDQRGTLTITISGTPAAATIGSPYSFTPTTNYGSGTKTFSYSGTSLSSFGMAFNTATGAITSASVSGSAGTITGTDSVSDASGSASLPISILVSAATGTFGIYDFSDPANSGLI